MVDERETVTLHIDRFQYETKSAVLVIKDGREYWFPLSTVHAMHKTTSPSIVVDYWIAKNKGLV